ncbi:hypothetical protein NKH77_36720 [Streptomyces sp. M19]
MLTDSGRALRLDLLRRMGRDSPLDHLSDTDRAELRTRLLRALDRAE